MDFNLTIIDCQQEQYADKFALRGYIRKTNRIVKRVEEDLGKQNSIGLERDWRRRTTTGIQGEERQKHAPNTNQTQ